ncbi:hypothetical protein BDU57DRAFT_517309 [Ampelomyces quisqualis]|uniref:Uncharacterized protein n=1 Tax=Ampelomyces quisqualis TaxID=50730 RepID=A0A6A5QQ13_AMPQU|nr:hypothetical protein BDU57DRAFT_517309 [Ampelomyces quisqualis]
MPFPAPCWLQCPSLAWSTFLDLMQHILDPINSKAHNPEPHPRYKPTSALVPLPIQCLPTYPLTRYPSPPTRPVQHLNQSVGPPSETPIGAAGLHVMQARSRRCNISVEQQVTSVARDRS